MSVDVLLRIASVVILLNLFYQFGGARGGTSRHIRMGYVAMFCGALIAVLVAIRAFRHDEPMSFLYGLHLVFGGLFLGSLFTTGFFGRRARKGTLRNARQHVNAASITSLLLILTLMVGIGSSLSS